MSTLVVIVNYRTPALVVECLRSLEAEVHHSDATSVFIVDNDSRDGSLEHITAAVNEHGWGHWVRVVASPVNGGFAHGNNIAIRSALAAGDPPDYVWLLNPDTRVREGALRELLAFMSSRPEVGIAGSAIEDDEGQLWPYAFRFPSVLSELDRGLRLGLVTRLLKRWTILEKMSESPAQVDWVSGASLMIRRRVIDEIGLMDEDYFLYFEETDYCRMAGRAGWMCWYVPQSRVLHLAGQSTGIGRRTTHTQRTPKYWFDSRRRYFIKNHSRAYAVLADLVWICSHAICQVRHALSGRRDPKPPHLLRDFVQSSALLTSDIKCNLNARHCI